ncbi:triose-phosphate isomerase [Nevskia soli]|uniref:triose-phosphate isomerase n=1 Tax=Nevskia soli TaxID=418856 RepID=UPI0004A747AA|nr:triose-phosphate isomerase [Nevskia soli]
MSRRYLIAGNWKMNGSLSANAVLLSELSLKQDQYSGIDMLVCPPAPYLESVGRQLGGGILLGAQNLSDQTKAGAYTGEVLGEMLAELGCRYVIVGHSERRALYGEDDATVARKFIAAQASGLIPILCVGETLEERESDATEAVLGRQLGAVVAAAGVGAFAKAVIAYEPVWAIGTGRTATAEQAQAAHAFLRGQLAAQDAKIANSTQLLYGGSVKADNAASLLSCDDVDGGLIGGASLKAADFLAICAAAQALSKN